jgi:hypothetical protein
MGIFKGKKKSRGADAGQASPGMQDFVQREFERLFGPRGPAHLFAMFAEPGIAEPGRVAWMAVPSWDHAQVVEASINAQAPAGWYSRAADWDYAMPNSLFIYVRDLFAAGLCNDEGMASDLSSARLGVAIGNRWDTWELNHEQPPVPDVLDERIWKTP